MEKAFVRDEVLSRLQALPFAGILAFGLSCAERMLPNYAAFSEAENWGSVDPLRQCLDAGWETLAGSEISRQTLERLENECSAVTPNTEDFQSIYTSAGLDAACAASQIVEFLRTSKSAVIADLAALARDTVDMYVQELEGMDAQDPRLEEKILAHPLMQKELARQRADLARLSTNDWSRGPAGSLRFEWRGPAVSNIGLRG